MEQEQTKHGISEDLLNKLFFYPIDLKCSALKSERETAIEWFNKSENEEEKKELRDKLQWLHEALLVVEKASEQNCYNRRYEPLEIPNVIDTPTEQEKEKLHKEVKEMANRKTKGEFKHPSNRTINCIGFEAAYDTPEGREYWRKRDEEFEEFKKNN